MTTVDPVEDAQSCVSTECPLFVETDDYPSSVAISEDAQSCVSTGCPLLVETDDYPSPVAISGDAQSCVSTGCPLFVETHNYASSSRSLLFLQTHNRISASLMRCVHSLRSFFIFVFVSFGLLFGMGEVLACDSPVYRYALERWEGASFPVYCFRGKRFETRHEGWLSALRTTNAKVTVVDVSQRESRVGFDLYEKYGKGKPLPFVVAFRPTTPETKAREAGGFSLPIPSQGHDASCPTCSSALSGESTDPVLFSAPLDSPVGSNLPDSPARRTIADFLINGGIAAWVVLKSGVQEKDVVFMRGLQERLDQAQKEMIEPELRNGRIRPEWGRATVQHILPLDKNDLHEMFFIHQLLDGKSVDTVTEPIAFPIYGRRRVLTAIKLCDIEQNTVATWCSYLVGPCSCEVKAQNPGRDLIFSANWNERVRMTIREKDSVDNFLPSFIQ